MLLLLLASCVDPGESKSDAGADSAGETDTDTDTDGDTDTDPDTDETGPRDADGDGALSTDDCDDADSGRYPGAEEVPYDGVDQDCDGADLTDLDGDGHDATVAGGDDCDDTTAEVPAASEVCDDGLDNDCDGAAPGCELALDGSLLDESHARCPSDYFVGVDVAFLGDLYGSGEGTLGVTGWADPDDHFIDTIWIFEGPLGGAFAMDDAASTIELYHYPDHWTTAYTQVAGGDLDGDGLLDVVGSAPFYEAEGTTDYAGAVFVFSGPPASSLDASSAATTIVGVGLESEVGWSIAVGDVDGDGFDDLLVDGVYGDEAIPGGEVGVFHGPVPAGDLVLGDAETRIVGDVQYGGLGMTTPAVGDLDGDGHADIALSDPGTHAAYVFAGTATGELHVEDAVASLSSSSGDSAWACAVLYRPEGTRLAVSSLVVGGGTTGGTVRVLDGPFTGARDIDDAPFSVVAEPDWLFFGNDVAAVGDVNGDGWTDLGVGASRASEGAYWGGGMAVFTDLDDGEWGVEDAAVRVWGETQDGYAGMAIAGGPDVTGDATDDFATGWGIWVMAGRGR